MASLCNFFAELAKAPLLSLSPYPSPPSLSLRRHRAIRCAHNKSGRGHTLYLGQQCCSFAAVSPCLFGRCGPGKRANQNQRVEPESSCKWSSQYSIDRQWECCARDSKTLYSVCVCGAALRILSLASAARKCNGQTKCVCVCVSAFSHSFVQ